MIHSTVFLLCNSKSAVCYVWNDENNISKYQIEKSDAQNIYPEYSATNAIKKLAESRFIDAQETRLSKELPQRKI